MEGRKGNNNVRISDNLLQKSSYRRGGLGQVKYTHTEICTHDKGAGFVWRSDLYGDRIVGRRGGGDLTATRASSPVDLSSSVQSLSQ